MFTRFFTFVFILCSLCALTSAAETYFEILDNESNSVFGSLIEFDQTRIVVDVQGKTQSIPLEKLVKIQNIAPSPYERSLPATGNQNPGQPTLPVTLTGQSVNQRKYAETVAKLLKSDEQAVKRTFPGSVVAIELKDGSLLTASSFIVVKSQGICRLLEQENDLSIPLDAISAVRFVVRSLSEVIVPPADWQRLAVPNAGGDRLVVGNPGTFDVYSGILNEVSAETVSFDVDGESLPVPRRRVFGLVFHGAAVSPASATPLATLTLWSGTKGMISDIRLKENELTWQTTAGVTVAVPLNMVSEIDFGEKGVAFLFDFERVHNNFSLPFASEVKLDQFKLLQTFYESRSKMSREIVLDGVAYEQGVTLHGVASLEYRLPKPFAVLKAVIGIEDQFRPHALSSLRIMADSQLLGSWTLRGDAAAQAIHLNLPQNCRVLTIIAEPAPQSDIPAVLTIADPKLFE